MTRMREWRWLRRGSEDDRRLDAELHDHMERLTADYVAAGMSHDEARRRARLEFGGLEPVKEACRDARGIRWLDECRQDLRYAVRTLARAPGFTATTVLTLALGIGMNTAVFSVLDAVLLLRLPYPDAERLLWVTTFEKAWNEEFVDEPDVEAWQEQAASFERIAAYETRDTTIGATAGPARARIALVSDDFWPLTGAVPVLGRLPRQGERELLLSYAFFERSFHGDAGIVGKPVMVGEQTVVVTGVLPRAVRLLLPGSVFSKIDGGDVAGYASGVEFGALNGVVAKLRAGVPIVTGVAELEVIRARRIQARPARWDETELRAMPLQEKIVAEARRPLWILMAAVTFVLLIAAANVATMLLARASARQKEMAVRASLGAGRARVLRQVMVESLLLAALGGVAGLLLAYWGLATVVGLMPDAVPRLAEASIAGSVLVFTAGVSIASALLFGIVPAAALWTFDLHAALKDGFKSATAPSGLRVRRLLVTMEIALAAILLAGAGLMVKSLWLMHQYPPGFHPERILSMKIPLSGPDYFGNLARQRAYFDEAFRRLEASPDVVAASLVYRGPAMPGLAWEGAGPPRDEGPTIVPTAVSADYATVMGFRIVQGRWFTDHENEPVIVINETLARRDFGSGDPLGRRLDGPGVVIGVVADLRFSKLDAKPEAEFFTPISRPDLQRLDDATLLVRTRSDAEGAMPAIQTLIGDIDPSQPVYDVKTMERALAESIAPRRFNLLLLGTFAVAALSMAMVGIYGVTAYAVAQRTHEIGVRITLGAMRRDVVRMVMGQGLAMAIAGVGIGLAVAIALTRVMTSLLYDVEPTDPGTFAMVGLVLGVTAIGACWLPSLKAAAIDPIVAMRHE